MFGSTHWDAHNLLRTSS